MKHLIFILTIALFATSCHENTSPCPGSSCAKLNGKKWKGAARGDVYDNGLLILDLPKPLKKEVCAIEQYAQWFTIQIRYSVPQIYVINASCATSCARFDILEGGDVTANTYTPINSPENTVNITHYDSVTNEIKGTFRITFAKDLNQQQLNQAPDTLRFTEGEFETVLEKK